MSKADDQMEYHKTFVTGGMRLAAIRSGLKLEIKIPGMRMTRNAPKCSTIMRKEFGLSGAPPKLLAQFEALLVKHGFAEITDSTPAQTAQAGNY